MPVMKALIATYCPFTVKIENIWSAKMITAGHIGSSIISCLSSKEQTWDESFGRLLASGVCVSRPLQCYFLLKKVALPPFLSSRAVGHV